MLCHEEINQLIPTNKNARPNISRKAMKNGAYPSRKPKREPGLPSINRTTGAKKAGQAGEPAKTPPLLPKAVIKVVPAKPDRDLTYPRPGCRAPPGLGDKT